MPTFSSAYTFSVPHQIIRYKIKTGNVIDLSELLDTKLPLFIASNQDFLHIRKPHSTYQLYDNLLKSEARQKSPLERTKKLRVAWGSFPPAK